MYLIGHRRSCTPERHLDLRHVAEPWPTRLSKLLQRAERAQPAAERAAAPEQQRRRDREPQDEDQRRHQEVVPAEVGPQRVDEGEDVDDRKLRLRVPAEPDQREDQEAEPHAVVQHRPAHEPVLEEEDGRSAPASAATGCRYRTGLGAPHRVPQRRLGRLGAAAGTAACRPAAAAAAGAAAAARGSVTEILVGQLVAEIEGQECLVARADWRAAPAVAAARARPGRSSRRLRAR